MRPSGRGASDARKNASAAGFAGVSLADRGPRWALGSGSQDRLRNSGLLRTPKWALQPAPDEAIALLAGAGPRRNNTLARPTCLAYVEAKDAKARVNFQQVLAVAPTTT